AVFYQIGLFGKSGCQLLSDPGIFTKGYAMYSVVLATMLAAGGQTADTWRHGCHGCGGGYSCHGCWGGYSCHGCYGGYSCHGCYGGYSCHGCYGGSSCYGCSGCY